MLKPSFIIPDAFVVHYSEIALKGGNRKDFERALLTNIRKAISKEEAGLRNLYGKIVLDLKKGADTQGIIGVLSKTPGVANFSPCYKEGLDIGKIEKKALEIVKGEDFSSFKVSAKRTNKKFSLKSDEINKLLGEKILEAFPQKKVSLSNPHLELFVEISEKESFIYLKKIRGVGGLPTGPSGKVVVSLSGGIDSPVASTMIMRRGCRAILVHIHNSSLQGEVVRDKIITLSRIIASYQPGINTELFIIPFEKIQKKIIMMVKPDIRMIIYRRFMMRILNKVARKVGAKAIVTGDSVAQVASQTLENLGCIHQASTLPVLSPLIGMNKEETIVMAKELGTFDTSIIPGEDCCSFMISKSPETHAKIEEVILAEEKILDREELVEEAVKGAEVIRV